MLPQQAISQSVAISPDFRRLWAGHGVSYQDEAPKRFRVREVGELTLEQRTLLLVVYAPADRESAEKARLLRARAAS